jgi:hypothetical protein
MAFSQKVRLAGMTLGVAVGNSTPRRWVAAPQWVGRGSLGSPVEQRAPNSNMTTGATQPVPQPPHYPDIFFKRMRQEAGCVGRCVERLPAFGDRELKEISHGPSER